MLSNDPAVLSLRDSASWLAGHGCRVFPLLPGGKQPAIKNWEHAATTVPGKVRQYWASQPFNIGVACGPSGLVVIDLDVAKPDATVPPDWDRPGIRDGSDVFAELTAEAGVAFPPKTFTVATPSGGTHFYHRAPAGTALRNSTSRLGWLIDTRAAGGYVVGPGSIINGTRYRTIDPTPPAPLPAWLTEQLTPPPTAVRALSTVPAVLQRGNYITAAVHAELAIVRAAATPGRNHTLNTAAYILGQLIAPGGPEHEHTAQLLTAAGIDIGLSEREAARTVASGLTAGARHPRQIGHSA